MHIYIIYYIIYRYIYYRYTWGMLGLEFLELLRVFQKLLLGKSSMNWEVCDDFQGWAGGKKI